MSIKNVSFIGLGVMGYPMAGHLQKNGYNVTVYNRTTVKAEKWVEEYKGSMAKTPGEASQNSEIVFMCVGRDEDIIEVMEGEDVILSKVTEGSISTKYWEPGFKDKLKIFKNLFKEVNSYRCIGFEYIDIGIGIRYFAILSKLSPWDHIPGILFVREAGGSDIDFDKNKYDFTKKNKNLIVSNSEDLNLKILERLGEYS